MCSCILAGADAVGRLHAGGCSQLHDGSMQAMSTHWTLAVKGAGAVGYGQVQMQQPWSSTLGNAGAVCCTMLMQAAFKSLPVAGAHQMPIICLS